MHLYHLTLQKPGAINCAVYGSFSAPKKHEFVVARGHVLELLRPDESGRLQLVHSTEVFGLIRSVLRYRLHGQEFDHILIASDSGRITVARYNEERRDFVVVQRETYGKTGCRRVTPGQFLAADPRGRAFMVAAIEKQRFVYQTNREEDLLTISSPLEAHRSATLVFDVVGVDAGFDNPCFACLELEYAEADADPSGEAAAAAQKVLAGYELDLGLNTVTRKWARETDRGANAVLGVPGGGVGAGSDGPGGVLVLAENWVIYERPDLPAGGLRAPIPRRADMPDERGLLLTAATLHRQRAGVFFALVQSELGDVYKVTLEYDAATGAVSDLLCQYFDTIPPAAALCVSRSGLLFAAAEFGAHLLYRIVGLGEGEPEAAVSRAVKVDAPAEGGGSVEVVCPVFTPRPLVNLAKVDEMPSLAPLTDIKLVTPPAALAAAAAVAGGAAAGSAAAAAAASAAVGGASASPFIAALCGRGPRSSLRVLREGLPVTEMAATSLPGEPTAIFTVRESASGAGAAAAAGGGGASESKGEDGEGASAPAAPRDRYIVLSFSNATMALAVGEAVEEVSAKDTGLLDTAPTLAVQALANDSLLQVHPGGMRLILGSGAGKRVQEWRAPGKRTVVAAACNPRQVVLALSGGDLVAFELDEQGRLEESARKSSGSEVRAMALGPVPHGRVRAPFFALADAGSMVRVLSLDPAAPLQQVAAQALRAPATSLAIAHLGEGGAAAGAGAGAAAGGAGGGAPSASSAPHLFIGLASGVLTRVLLDPATGGLSDPRSRFLGPLPVKLQALTLAGRPAVLALSSRPWAAYRHRGVLHVSPLSYAPLAAAAGFASDVLPDSGVVAVAGDSLRILLLERLGEALHSTALPLRYTPRRLALHPTPTPPSAALPQGQQLAVVIESDHNAMSAAARAAAAAAAAAAPAADAGAGAGELAAASSSPPAAPSASAASGASEGEGDGMEMEMEMDEEEEEGEGRGRGAASASASSAVLPSAAGAGSGSGGASPAGAPGAAGGSGGGEVAYAIAAPSVYSAEGAGGDASADPQAEGVDPRRVGFSPPAAPGCWGSAIRVVDLTALAGAGEEASGGSLPSTHHSCTHHLTELGGGEAAVSCAVLHFHEHPGDAFVVVGTVTGMTYHPRAHRGAALRTYRLVAMAGVPVDEAGREVAAGSPAAAGTRTATRLQFLHRTPVEEAPYALAAFHGRLLAGVGRTLRLYDLGKRRLLRKGEARGFPTLITGLSPSLDRVFVADAAESVHVVRYRRSDGSLAVVADDVTARHTSALLPLDHDTVAGGDRFGNLFVLRMPPDADEEGADNPTGSRLLWSAGAGGGGAPNKLQQVAQFYVGEAVTGLQKGSLAGGSEVILYSTISGTVGCLAPLTAREDVDLLTHLELFLRHEGVSLVGRDHAAYRSYFIPLKDVVDGDLCEAFASLPAARQKAVAADLERTPGEVAKKLEDVRNRVL